MTIFIRNILIFLCSLTILVNRGWVPLDMKDPRARSEGQIEGEVELEGILRLKEDKPTYAPTEFNKGPEFRYRLGASRFFILILTKIERIVS